MTERIVRPVRAWADYDEWSVLTNKEMVPGGFARYAWPTTGNGEPVGPAMCSGMAHAIREGVVFGALRSLRVLYENGYELTLGYDREFSLWDWFLSHPDTGQCAKGDFAEDADSEAVERAMIAAAAWFSQRQDGV